MTTCFCRVGYRIARGLASAVLLCLSLVLSKAADGPQLAAVDVRNAADFSTGAVAPGEVVVLFPSNAGPSEMVPWGLEANLGVTNSIGGTRVYFDNISTPIIYTVHGRIATVVPFTVAGHRTTELVVEYKGNRSAPVMLAVVATAPAVFTLDATGKGQAAMLNETGCCNSVRNPAVLGSAVSLYATGEGKLIPETPAKGIKVTVGGVPASILFVQNDGSLQVDFRVPSNAPIGDDVPLVLTVGGRSSSPEVTMAVRSLKQKVFVLSSDALVSSGLKRILESAGYLVATGDEVEDSNTSAQQPDLLALDLKTLRSRDLDVIGKMRAAHPHLRILVVAADLDPATLREADLVGAQSVVTKPLDSLKVLSCVRILLRKRPAVY